jgi:hypothetical protein
MVIEDLPPVPGTVITLRVPEKVNKVTQIPENRPLPLEQSGEAVYLKVPEFRMHTAIVFEY